MDIEQLKLILETIQDMGGDAKEFGIWYLICQTIPDILAFLFGIACLRCLYLIVRHISRSVIASYDMLRALNIDVPNHWRIENTEEAVRCIKELQDK